MQFDRRAMMGAGAAAAVMPALMPAARAADPRVTFKVPDGACDCHQHLYDPRFA